MYLVPGEEFHYVPEADIQWLYLLFSKCWWVGESVIGRTRCARGGVW